MAEADGTANDAGAAAGQLPQPVDWPPRIRARLAGSRPRHDPAEWLVPGLTAEESRAYHRFFPSDPIPAAVLVPIV